MSALKIYYCQKVNRKKIYEPLYDGFMQMLELCRMDLWEKGCVGRVQVIFQYGESQTQKTTAGRIFKGWMPLSVFVPKIYVYAYGHYPRYHVHTLAHEFGHLYHFQCIKDSYRWTPDQMEQFADNYAAAKLRQWDEYRKFLPEFSSMSHDHKLKLLSVLRRDDHDQETRKTRQA